MNVSTNFLLIFMVFFLIMPTFMIAGLDVSAANEEEGGTTEGQGVVDFFKDVFENDWELGEKYNEDEDGKGYAQSRNLKGSGYEPIEGEKVTAEDVKITPILSPETSEDEIIDLIKTAKDTLDIEQMYIYDTLTDIVDAIIDAHNDGVTVRVILNDADNANSKATADSLVAKGIAVKICDGTVPMYFDTLHNKGVIVDGKIVLIASINWSPTSLRENREAGLIIESEDITKHYQELFDHDWSVCEDYDDAVHLQSANLGSSINIGLETNVENIELSEYEEKFTEVESYEGDMTVYVCSSPDDCYEVVSGLLKNAVRTIDISVYTLSSPHLLDILANRIDNGVEVRLLLEKNQVSSSERNYNRYTMYNLTVKGINGRKAQGLWATEDFDFQHCKYCIIDGEILILSSGNWGRSSCPKPQEDGDVDGNRDWWIVIYGTLEEDLQMWLIILIVIISAGAAIGIIVLIKKIKD
ncbi:MAG: phospholipase D-like domain-containing protein [Promethearchaeota archaeon]